MHVRDKHCCPLSSLSSTQRPHVPAGGVSSSGAEGRVEHKRIQLISYSYPYVPVLGHTASNEHQTDRAE